MINNETTKWLVLVLGLCEGGFRCEMSPACSMKSVLTSEINKNAVSPERELILPKRKDSELLSVQLVFTVVCTSSLVEYLIEMVLKLLKEFGHLH
jgi:hypothetical protein